MRVHYSYNPCVLNKKAASWVSERLLWRDGHVCTAPPLQVGSLDQLHRHRLGMQKRTIAGLGNLLQTQKNRTCILTRSPGVRVCVKAREVLL